MSAALFEFHRESAGERTIRTALREARLPFKQEALVKGYQVDFLVGQTLIVEVDGPFHLVREQIDKDLRRDAVLRAAGYEVLRIPTDRLKNPADRRQVVRQLKEIYEARHAPSCRASSLPTQAQQALMRLRSDLARR